jgi:hypothetical protein
MFSEKVKGSSSTATTGKKLTTCILLSHILIRTSMMSQLLLVTARVRDIYCLFCIVVLIIAVVNCFN